MNPSTSAKEKEWWLTPWKTEKRGVKYGGWGDINVNCLEDLEDVMDNETGVTEGPVPSRTTLRSNISENPLDDEERELDMNIAEAGVHEVMSNLCSKILVEESSHEAHRPVKPTATYQGIEMYKSTIVAEYVGNPQLSKDRLTRVRETFYVNSQVDKAKEREDILVMMMQI
ncbi:unnamed protein product [Calypogeia fissa]